MPQTARPTEAQARQTIVDIGNAFFDQVTNDGPSQLTRINAITGNYKSQQPEGDLSVQRARLNAVLQGYRTQMIAAFRDLAKANTVDIIIANGLTNTVFRQIREFIGKFGRFTAATKRHVNARGWSRGGEISANGVNLFRLNVDRDAVDHPTGHRMHIT